MGVGLTQALLLLSVGGQVFGVDGQKAVVESVWFGVGAISAESVNHQIA